MKDIKLPKYIVKELYKASDYAQMVDKCISKFEQWVKENVDENFDFDALRAMSYEIGEKFQTEALTDIEHGTGVDAEEIEKVLNYWTKR